MRAARSAGSVSGEAPDAVRGPLGILAGAGRLPHEIAAYVTARGRAVHFVAIEGENFDGEPHALVKWGQVGAIVTALRDGGCRDLVIAGHVRRPDLRKIKPDLGFFRAIASVTRAVFSGGDDALLRGVATYFESEGFRVVGASEVAPELLIRAGPLGASSPTPEQLSDISLGFDILRRLGPYDVGQAVVVSGGRVRAVEGADGTDAMLARVAGDQGAPGGVFVKGPKPGQSLKVDVPAIGPDTVSRAAAAGLAGIAVHAGATIVIDRAETAKRADGLRAFVQGVEPPSAALSAPAFRRPSGLRALGRRRVRRAWIEDAARVLGVVEALQPACAQACAVSLNRHVLAVGAEADLSLSAIFDRASRSKPWGLSFGRKAVAAVGPGWTVGAADVRGAASSGLAGIVILGGRCEKGAIESADALGLFIASPVSATPS